MKAVWRVSVASLLVIACTTTKGNGNGSQGCTCSKASSDPCATQPTGTPPQRVAFAPAFAHAPMIDIEGARGTEVMAKLGALDDRGLPFSAVVLDAVPVGSFVVDLERFPDFSGLSSEIHRTQRRVLVSASAAIASDARLPPGDGEPGVASQRATSCNRLAENTSILLGPGRTAGLVDLDREGGRAFLQELQLGFPMRVDGVVVVPVAELASPSAGASEDVEALCETVTSSPPAVAAALATEDTGFAIVVPLTRAHARASCGNSGNAPRVVAGLARGDRGDLTGLADALDRVLRAASAGDPLPGLRVGGDGATSFDLSAYGRWAAASSFLPLMVIPLDATGQPVGSGAQGAEALALLTPWAKLHDELATYVHSSGLKGRVVEPLGDAATYRTAPRFKLGAALLAAPVVGAAGTRDVELPAGDRWFSFWDSAVTAVDGGTVVKDASGERAERMPLFVREGSIVPLHATGSKKTMLLVYPGAASASFEIHVNDQKVAPVTIGATVTAERQGQTTSVRLTSADSLGTTFFRVVHGAAIGTVRLDGDDLPRVATREALDTSGPAVWIEPSGLAAVANIGIRGAGLLEILNAGSPPADAGAD